MSLPSLERLDVLADTGTKAVFNAVFDVGGKHYAGSFAVFHRGGWSERAEEEAKRRLAEACARAWIDSHFEADPESRAQPCPPSYDAVLALLDKARTFQPDWFRGCRLARKK